MAGTGVGILMGATLDNAALGVGIGLGLALGAALMMLARRR